jgi:hypothetical protein
MIALQRRLWNGPAHSCNNGAVCGGVVMADQNSVQPDVFAIARAAGLDKAVAEFPDCVADAARAAALDLADMPAIDGAAEPWPPMSIRSSR